MSNMLDYMAWRGDLAFSASPLNEIDVLVFCQITYLNFDGILENGNFKTALSLSELAERFRKSPDFKKRSDVGVLINQGTSDVLFAAAETERYKDVKITGLVSITDIEKEEQFAALTYVFAPKKNCVVYRGTDDTIVGFKEDFNLAIMDEVPAQKDSVSYVENVAKNLKGDIFLVGHSKGGNLSVFAAAMCQKETKRRIKSVYNMDGPGFSEKRIQSNEFYEVIPKLHSYYPHFSIVGMIFSHAGKYSVVDSDQSGILQHDPLSWHIKGNHFELREDFDEAALFFTDTLNKWILSLSREQQVQFIETLYKILQSTEAKTNSEIESNLFKNYFTIWKSWKNTDAEIRKNVEETVRQLFKIAHKQMPSLTELLEKKSIFKKDKN